MHCFPLWDLEKACVLKVFIDQRMNAYYPGFIR